tara:strand:- start:1068 stop:1598 length:531 start_codon:yes stop_codon:yes gene_type:complete
MNYKVDQIITNEDRHNLIDLYNSLDSNIAHQDYNLYNIDKRRLNTKDYTQDKKYHDIIKKIEAYAKRKTHSHYFVMYHEGSYTRMHTDDDEAVGQTIVTLVDTVDLIGGDTLALLSAELTEDKKGYQKGDDHKGRVVPRVIRMDVGDSVSYDRSLLHGVSQLERGKRLVLVSWFLT